MAFTWVHGAAALTLPAATFVETVGMLSDPDPSAPNSLATSFQATNGSNSAQLTGSVSTTAGSRPSLTLSATAEGGGSFRIDSFATIFYAFAVTGPASATPIPILVTYSGVGSATGATADGLGRITVTTGTGTLLDLFGVSSVFGPAGDTFGGVAPLTALVDQLNSVRLEGVARAQAEGGISQADIFVDPQIAIDPSFANAGLYQIVFPENLVVPEPALGLLAVVGLAAGALRRRFLP